MKAQDAIQKMINHKGQNVRAVWSRPIKTRKEFAGIQIVKTVSAIVRAGIDYSNMQKNRDIETGPLPWGEWDVFPFSIIHKGVDYIRLYPPNGLRFYPIVSYTKNGKPVTAEEVKPFCLASEFSKGDAPDCFTIKAENLVSIG